MKTRTAAAAVSGQIIEAMIENVLGDLESDDALRRIGLGQAVAAPRKPRRPSLVKAIKTARRAGVDRGTVSVGGVSVTFDKSDPVEATGNALDNWLRKKNAHPA